MIISDKEKKVVYFLMFLIFLNLIINKWFLASYRTSYMKILDEYNLKRTSLLNMREKHDEVKERQIDWENAISDLKQVENEYFFPAKEGMIPIRKEIERLSQSSGLEVYNIKYSLREIGEGISLYELDFPVRGNYFNLIKFLDAIESRDVFLFINKLDFSNISQDELEIKLKLHAYIK